jgi:hypothetical protein
LAIFDDDERRDRPQPPFSLRVTGGVSPIYIDRRQDEIRLVDMKTGI